MRPVGITVSESGDLVWVCLPLSHFLAVPWSDLTSLTSVSSGKEPVPALGVMIGTKCVVLALGQLPKPQ